MTPHANPFITIDNIEQWDFVLRQLFAVRGKPLSKAIGHIASGAAVLLKSIDGQFNVDKQINELTVQDWDVLLKAFAAWPFRPEVLTQFSAREWLQRSEKQEARI